MNKKILVFIVFTICLVLFGCGKDEIEYDSSVLPIDETSVSDSLEETTEKITESTKTVTTTKNSNTNITQTTTIALKVEDESGTNTTRSGETVFVPISGVNAIYGARVPSNLTPHEIVIYTTAPVSGATTATDTSQETVTTAATITTTQPPTTAVILPDPVSINDVIYLGYECGADAGGLVSDTDAFESMPSDYYIDDIQGEDRVYSFDGLTIETCYFDSINILRRVTTQNPSYITSRGIGIGMTLNDIELAYGLDYVLEGDCYTFYFNSMYMKFKLDSDIITSICYGIDLY